MRFVKYIKDDVEVKSGMQTNVSTFIELRDLIEKRCSQYLKEIRAIGIWTVYRGINKPGNLDVHLKQGYVKNRRPKDTPQWAHDYMNEYAKKIHGFPIRNGVSTTNDYSQAKFYGQPYLMCPVNGYKYAFIPSVYDLYAHLDDEIGAVYQDYPEMVDDGVHDLESAKNPNEGVKEILQESIERYETKGLKKAFQFKSEIMWYVKEYYLVRTDLLTNIIGRTEPIG